MKPMNKEKRTEFSQNALNWLSVKFVHQGRTRNGVDCIGLVLGSMKESNINLNLSDEVMRKLSTYSRDAFMRTEEMHEYANEYLIPISKEEMEPGDIVLIKSGRFNRHWGIVSEGNTIIHASPVFGHVAQHRIDAATFRVIAAVYRLPEG